MTYPDPDRAYGGSERRAKTSRNICRTSDVDGMVIYKAECDCCGECGHTFVLEYDTEAKALLATFYVDVCYAEQWGRGWWDSFCRRVASAWSILFRGRQNEMCVEYIFGGKEHIRDYIAALEEGLAKVEVME